jgi:hypothetical protein
LLDITTLFFSVSGDTVGAAASSGGAWAGVDHVTTNWEWNYKAGGTKTKFDTNGTIQGVTGGSNALNGTGVTGSYGFFGVNVTGKGVGSMVGTVTVTANANGVYEGGGFLAAGTDAFANSGGEIATTVSTAAFTVVPEPGTAVLMLLGLGGLGVMGRKNR